MIISASYKTDIPTFYGDWFMTRLRAGFCNMVNPYNRRVVRVSLDRADVDGIVFWTKNVGPFLPRLSEVRDRGFPFIVQHTINGYPRELEHAVVDANKSVEYLRRIADDFGPRVAVWRYDTIVISSLTTVDFHRQNFERLARALKGTTDEVVVSFMHAYHKSEKNIRAASRATGFTWTDPPTSEKRRLVSELSDVAASFGIRLSVCSQRDYLVPNAADARCIDANRIHDVARRPFHAALKGNREECGCFSSRDIGEYDTCPHGCVYCYAVRNRDLALRRHAEHDPKSTFLFQPSHVVDANDSSDETPTLPFACDDDSIEV